MKLAVVVPIGPSKIHLKWLDECFASIYAQTRPADELIIVDDMAHKEWVNYLEPFKEQFTQTKVVFVQNPWLMGVAASFNIGIAYSNSDLTFMLGGDDKLLPTCMQQIEWAYNMAKDPLGYYYVDVVYDNGEQQNLPCHAAAVSKKLWNHTGGFAPETAIGAPDAAFVSTLLGAKGRAGHLIRVAGGPQYWVRRHADQDTAKRGPYQGAILAVRNILTANWVPANWGRYE